MSETTGINPNTPVALEGTGSVGTMSDASTFDTMDALVETQVAEKIEAKAEQRAENKEVKDAAKDAAEMVLEKVVGAKKADKDEAASKAAEKTESQLKVVRAYDSTGKEIELSDDIQIEQKVDGKLVKVSLADLGKNYSGKVVYEKKFNDLHVERTKFKESVDFVNQRIDHVLQLSQTKPLEGFFELCKIAGKKPEDQIKAWGSFSEEAQRWNGMSEAEQKAELATSERDYYKRSIEADEKAKADRQAAAQREAETQQIREQLKITPEEYTEAQTFAANLYPNQELTVQHVVAANRLMVSESVMKEVAPEMLVSGNPAIGELFKVAMNNPEFDRNDLKDIAEKAFGLESAKRLGRKTAPQVQKQAHQKPEKQPVSWDDV